MEGGESPADLVRASWPFPEAAREVPRIESSAYGVPDGAPRIAPTDSLVALIFEHENWTAGQWLRDEGSPALLRTIGRLPGEPDRTILESTEGEFEVTSVGQLRRRRVGFLSAENTIAIGSGYFPLMPFDDDRGKNLLYYTANAGAHKHGVNMPYVQLLACQKQ